MKPHEARWLAACALSLVACATDPEPDTGHHVQADTGPYAFSCPALEASGPAQCKSVPTMDKPATPEPDALWSPWIVDGTIGRNEYYGAVTFPYANPRMKAAGGKVLVAHDSTTLHVFLKDLPGTPSGSVRIYLDYGRGEGRSADTYVLPDGEDRAYDLDLATGSVVPMKAVTTAGVTRWVPIQRLQLCLPRRGCKFLGWADEVPPFSAALGPSHGPLPGDAPRFDAEFSIGLRALASVAPFPDAPAVGFAVAQLQPNGTVGVGAYPEELAAWVWPAGATQAPIDDNRILWETLLFGPPRGTDVSFATFNVKRFTAFMHGFERAFSSDALDDFKIPDEEIGKYLASWDVIGLEEAWDPARFQRILDTANAVRASRGLGPYYVAGPPREKDPGLFSKLSTLGTDENNGGIYILSRYPIARTGWEAYGSCRGEDCVKQKGVEYARIWFGAPDPTCNPNVGCPPPSGDGYIDVFATHLNADPELCSHEFDSEGAYFKDFAETAGICLLGVEACFLYNVYEKGVFQCADPATNAEARARQLVQLGAYIRRQVADDPTRPSIVMGDFNIDGRLLNPARAGEWNALEYKTMVRELDLVPLDHAEDLPPLDYVNPWRGAYGWPWDIDHADLVRETVAAADLMDGAGATTGIGADRAPGEIGPRYDYIFVRPGVRPEADGFATQTRWVAAKTAAPVWSSPFPTASVPIESVGNRLSDHAPVIANLKLVQLEVPPVYHASWPHAYTMRVTSAIADDSDCILGVCGGLDLYPNLAKLHYDAAGVKTEAYEHGETCDNRNAVSVNDDGCMASWRFDDFHDPATVSVLAGGASLWDADSGPDDFYSTVPGDRAPVMYTTWAAANVSTAGWKGGVVPACPLYPIRDNSHVPCCSSNGGNVMCLETSWKEIVP